MEITSVEIDFDLHDILDGVLHFKNGLLTDIQADAWKKSLSQITCIIENCFKNCLKVRPDDPDGCRPVFANPGTDQQTFELQLYKTNGTYDGLSVAFSVQYKNEKYHLYCTEDLKLYFTKGDCPSSIAGNRSDIIFFQKEFSDGDNCFKFRSSLHADYYLAVSDEGGKEILILKKSCDKLDETKKFNIKE
ncbi:interleukin-18-like [Dendropsophus ebraccatus]|uniref:interleukin-18-like n=1 Tax=Dendropsophus ebraccatus TaxID=150705 RepID=UPI0038318428